MQSETVYNSFYFVAIFFYCISRHFGLYFFCGLRTKDVRPAQWNKTGAVFLRLIF